MREEPLLVEDDEFDIFVDVIMLVPVTVMGNRYLAIEVPESRKIVESVVSTVFCEHFGQCHFSSFAEQMASFATYLAKDHPFQDGNKRTATVAMVAFLQWYGRCSLVASNRDVYDMIQAVTSDKMSITDLTGWITSHVR